MTGILQYLFPVTTRKESEMKNSKLQERLTRLRDVHDSINDQQANLMEQLCELQSTADYINELLDELTGEFDEFQLAVEQDDNKDVKREKRRF